MNCTSEAMLNAYPGSQEFIAEVDAHHNIIAGDKLGFVFDMDKGHFFDTESEQRITSTELVKKEKDIIDGKHSDIIKV